MKSTITFIITDTHFGVKQNSMTWLNSQIDFLYKQLIPHIEQCKNSNLYNKIRLIHMGDVFDSRSTISTMVATKVIEVFTKLCSLCEVHIIAGNHDYYSPNSNDVNTLDLLLEKTGAILYTKTFEKILSKGTSPVEWELFVPWYDWGTRLLDSVFQAHSREIKNIFIHADIVTENIPHLINKNTRVFSGHLHIPKIKNNLYNIGSCYALNFADANQERGYYTMVDNNEPEFHPNKCSIRFWRLYNEDIFNKKKTNQISHKDYVEMYISQSNMMDPRYIEQINKATKELKNIWVIPQTEEVLGDDMEKFEGYDIEKITKKMIPDELKDKFDMVLNSIQKSVIINS